MITNALPGRTVIIDGQEKLYFSGTSYLGINHQPAYLQWLTEGMGQYGGNYSSSRSSNLQLAVYEEAEQFLARSMDMESVLTFSSGFQAGQALMNALPRDAHYIFAPKTHPAVWQSGMGVWQDNFPSWVLSLPAQVSAATEDQIVIVSNSLDPLFAEKYKFNWLTDLPTDKNIHVIIDDSHGLGVLGANGEGIIQEAKPYLPPHVQLSIVGSIGKALGVPGGMVAGRTAFVQQLRKSPFFTAASPIPPAYLYAFLRAQPIYQQARKHLKANVRQFQQELKAHQLFRYFDTYPVFYTPFNELSQAVEDSCVLSSFPYPDPESEAVTRVVINALHREEDIHHLASQLIRAREIQEARS